MVLAPYPAAVRLCALAAEHWATIDGEAASRGVDYLSLPFDRFLNVIHWWAMHRVADPRTFAELLELPLETDLGRVTTKADLDQDAENFVAFAAAFGVKPDATGNGPAQLPSATST